MKIKDYEQGLVDGAKATSDAVTELGDKQREEFKRAKVFRESVVDLIRGMLSDADSKELLEKLLRDKEMQMEPARYKTTVVFCNKDDGDLANALRTDLRKAKNDCGMLKFAEFKKHGAGKTDFVIYVGNPEKAEVGNRDDLLYEAFGCRIFKSGEDLIAEYDSKVALDEEDRTAFIRYYKETLEEALPSKDQAKIARKTKRYERQQNTRKNRGDTPLMQGIFAFVENRLDDIIMADLPKWVQVPAVIAYIPAVFASLIVAIPVGISEVIINTTIDEMQDNSFDGVFLAKAQRQLLQVKILEYIKNKQIQNSR